MTLLETAANMRNAAKVLREAIAPIDQPRPEGGNNPLWWLDTDPFKQTARDLEYEAGRIEDFANRNPGDRE